MATLNFIMYLFFRYYSTGPTRSIAYFKALSAVAFLIYFHIFQILIIIGQVDNVIPINEGDFQITKYWKMALFLLPIFLLLYFLIKPQDLQDLEYDESKIKRGNIYLIVYCISSFILLFVLAFIFAKRHT